MDDGFADRLVVVIVFHAHGQRVLAGRDVIERQIVGPVSYTHLDVYKRQPQGSLYPALYRLEHRGWIAAEWGESENKRKARYYHLTAAGRRQLKSERQEWKLSLIHI